MTTVRAHFTRVYALLTVLLVAMGLLGFASVMGAARSNDELANRVQPMRVAAASLAASANEASRGIRGYFLTREPHFLDLYENSRLSYGTQVDLLTRLAAVPERPLVDQQVQLLQQWFARGGSAADIQARYGTGQPVSTPQVSQAGELLDQFMQKNRQLDQTLAQQQQQLRDRTTQITWVLVVGIAAALLAAIALAWLTARRLTRRVVQPLGEIARSIDRLAEDDHETQVQVDQAAPHEVQSIARSVRSLSTQQQLIERMRAERTWVRMRAHTVGHAVRKHLTADQITYEALTATGEAIDAQSVTLYRMVEDHRLVVARRWNQGKLEPLDTSTLRAEQPETPLPWLDQIYLAPGCVWVPWWDGGQGHRHEVVGPAETTRLVRHVGQVLQHDESLTSPHGGCYAAAIGEGSTATGLLAVVIKPGHAWSEVHAEFIEAVASELGQALHHARLYEQRGQVIEGLRELDQAKSDFLATVSHELRTPLTSITGYTQLLLNPAADPGEQLPESAREMVEVVERNSRRLQALIEDLLTLSREDSGGEVMRHDLVEVAQLVGSVAELIEPMARQQQVRLTVDAAAGPLTVVGDRAALERALLNVVSNAVKFSHCEGVVTVTVRRAADEVIIEVADQGIGIPRAEQDQLFSRFFRASNATASAVPGTGLGLAIVASIIERHNGRVELASRQGEGTTVTIHLPGARVGLPAQVGVVTGQAATARDR